jgi:hypothetical protein
MEDSIEMWLEDVDWINQAQDRGKSQAAVNTLVILRFP